MAIKFQYFSSELHEGAFNNFIDETYGSKSFLKSQDYINWWFGNNLRDNSNELNILLAVKDGKILGMNAMILTPLAGIKSIKKIGWLANTMIRPEYRNKGLGIMLVKKISENLDITGSISFKPKARKILEYLEYQIFEKQMQRSIIIANKDKFFSTFDVLENDIKHISTYNVDSGYESARVVDVSEIDLISSIWSRNKDRYGVTTERSKDFLLWRYCNHPVGVYYFLVPPTENPDSVAVLRIENVVDADFKVARIVDIFGAENDVFNLLKSLEVWLYAKDICFGDFFCNQSPDGKAFESSHFFWLPENSENIIPFLFQPLTFKSSYSEGIAIKSIEKLSINKMYITRGDSDRDRPTYL